MKKLFIVLAMLCSLVMVAPHAAANDWAVGAEIMIGSAHGKTAFGFGVKSRFNNIEGHYAQWDGLVPSKAFGIGYRMSTEGRGTAGDKHTYVSYTPGFAFILANDDVWLDLFNRAHVGSKVTKHLDVELGIINYFDCMNLRSDGTFGTIGLVHTEREDNGNNHFNGNGPARNNAGGGSDNPGNDPSDNPDDPVDDPEDSVDDGNNGHGNDEGDDPSNPGNTDDDPDDGNSGWGND